MQEIEIKPTFFQGIKIKFLYFRIERKRKNLYNLLDKKPFIKNTMIIMQKTFDLIQEREKFRNSLFTILNKQIVDLKSAGHKFSGLQIEQETGKIFTTQEAKCNDSECDCNSPLENQTVH